MLVLGRQKQRHQCTLVIATGKERQSLHVVPVQVRQEHGAPERAITEQFGQSPQSGPAVEQQGRPMLVAVVRERNTRRVPAVADELGTR